MAQTRASKGEMLMRKQIEEIHADVAFLRGMFTKSGPIRELAPQQPPPKTVVEEPRKMTGCPVCDGQPMPMDPKQLQLCRAHAMQMFPGMKIKLVGSVEAVKVPVAEPSGNQSLVDQVLGGAA